MKKRSKRKRNPVWLLPAGLLGGLAVVALSYVSVQKMRSRSRRSGDKNLHFVVDRDTSIPVINGVTKGGSWLLVLPDAKHESAVRSYITELASRNPNVNFAVFAHNMVLPDKIAPGAWGGVEGIVDRQSLGVTDLRDQWKDAVTFMLGAVIEATPNLGALPASEVLEAVGIQGAMT